MRATVSSTLSTLFNIYHEKVTNPDYHPINPSETLKARLTAVWLLQSDDPKLVLLAEHFIKKTSTSKEDDFERLKAFSATVTDWHDLQICSSNVNISGPSLEYKLSIGKGAYIEIIHRHALYRMEGDNCCFVSQTEPQVRVIGDPVLHQPGQPFPKEYSANQYAELLRQIKIAKDLLVKTGGGGIAANQCAAIEKPYQFAIVGVFYDISEHAEGVKRRYPNANFPQAKIMVNPEVIRSSSVVQHFKHACLSVPSPNRCEIESPEEMTVHYQDPTRNMLPDTLTMKGIDAVALWHEMNHILDGKTYIDTMLAKLSSAHFNALETRIGLESQRRKTSMVAPELSVPPFYFTVLIDEQGQSQLDETVLNEVVSKMTDETLAGILSRCQWLRSLKEKEVGVQPGRANDAFFKVGEALGQNSDSLQVARPC